MALKYLFRRPDYPLIGRFGEEVYAVIDGSELTVLIEKLNAIALVDCMLYDIQGGKWDFYVSSFSLIPNMRKKISKRELIELVNMRSNRSNDSVAYSMSSMGAKSFDRIFLELAELLGA